MNSIIEINQKIEKLFAKNTDKNLKSFAIIIYTEKGWAALMMPAISADSEKKQYEIFEFFYSFEEAESLFKERTSEETQFKIISQKVPEIPDNIEKALLGYFGLNLDFLMQFFEPPPS